MFLTKSTDPNKDAEEKGNGSSSLKGIVYFGYTSHTQGKNNNKLVRHVCMRLTLINFLWLLKWYNKCVELIYCMQNCQKQRWSTIYLKSCRDYEVCVLFWL